MKDFSDDILKGTAMEEVLIIKTSSNAQPISPSIDKVNPKKGKHPFPSGHSRAKNRSKQKSSPLNFMPKSQTDNRRGTDYATIRILKEYTLSLKVLFNGQKLTDIMDKIIGDYLEEHQDDLDQKYRQLRFKG